MKSRTTALTWVKAQVGKSLDWDGHYGAQCVDLIRHYVSFLGETQPPGVRGAVNLWGVAWDPQFKKVTNRSDPVPGDIVIFDESYAGGYGHVAIVLTVAADSFTSMDQNWFNSSLTKGSPAATVRHARTRIKGYIRPIWTPAPAIATKYTVLGLTDAKTTDIFKRILQKTPTADQLKSWRGQNPVALYETVCATLNRRIVGLHGDLGLLSKIKALFTTPS